MSKGERERGGRERETERQRERQTKTERGKVNIMYNVHFLPYPPLFSLFKLFISDSEGCSPHAHRSEHFHYIGCAVNLQ